MNEDQFFGNIATRLGRSAPLPTAPQRSVKGAPDFWRQSVTPIPELVETFQRELEVLGGQVHVVGSLESLREDLSAQLAALAPRRIGYPRSSFVTDYQLYDIVSAYDAVEWGSHGVEGYQTVDVSLSGCAYAVANTGTVVMMSSPGHGRSIAVLPAVHIVLVHAHQIRGRLGEVLEDIADRKDALPSSIHFISGPSRSSDIENDQTIGIHGPAAVMVYVLHDATSDSPSISL